MKFGEEVEGYNIPVLNEREIRAAAGILFLFLYTTVLTVIFTEQFLLIKYSVTIFLSDFIIRVFISPRYAPSLILGRFMVRNQVPEYVGAQQKRFAWQVGVVLASIFFFFLVVTNSYSPITGIICWVCLFFLFFEAVFGICLGCKFYPWFHKEKPQLCPGEVCEPKARQKIQLVNGRQWLIVLAFVIYIVVISLVFNDYFSLPPYDLFGLEAMMEADGK